MDRNCLPADWPAPATIIAGTTLRHAEDFAFPATPRWLMQVHGNRVVNLDSDDFAAGPPRADGVLADRPGAICAVRTADCLPVLFCSRDGGRIAAAHAGWRGLAAGILEETVTALGGDPTVLLAWFGPAISQAAFEVGSEVRAAFLARDGAAEAAFVANDRGRWQADLGLLARQQLNAVGVTAIFGGEHCTFADADRFFSYRRDGETGRLVSFVFRAA